MRISDWSSDVCSSDLIVHWVRNDAGSPNRMMPILMMTANSEQEYVCRARDCGVSEFVAKPYTVQSFYTRLVTAIARPRQFVRIDDYFGPARPRRRAAAYQGPQRRDPPGARQRQQSEQRRVGK